MELRQLEYFLAVAEHANFTRAAAALHVAQPWVSAQVRRLERELGRELFDRSSRALKLTEFGRALLPLARAALQTVGEIRTAAHAMTGVLCGRLAIGTVAHPLPFVADALAELHEIHPEVTITMTEARSEQLLAGLLGRHLDLAIVGLSVPPHPQLCEQTLLKQRVVAIVHRDDPLAGRGSITIAELRDRTLISHPEGSGVRALLDQACLEMAFTPRIAFETSSVDMMGHLVARNLGVAVVPAIPPDRLGDLCQIDLSDESMAGHLVLVWRKKDATPETVAFSTYVTALCLNRDNLIGAQ